MTSSHLRGGTLTGPFGFATTNRTQNVNASFNSTA